MEDQLCSFAGTVGARGTCGKILGQGSHGAAPLLWFQGSMAAAAGQDPARLQLKRPQELHSIWMTSCCS